MRLEWCNNDVVIVLRWLSNDFQLELKLCQNDDKMVLSWCCHGVAIVVKKNPGTRDKISHGYQT
jgi:hypothetical protein